LSSKTEHEQTYLQKMGAKRLNGRKWGGKGISQERKKIKKHNTEDWSKKAKSRQKKKARGKKEVMERGRQEIIVPKKP